MALWLNYCFPGGTQWGLLMNRLGGGGDGMVAVSDPETALISEPIFIPFILCHC